MKTWYKAPQNIQLPKPTGAVTALDVSDWISRKVRRRDRSSRLVALHGLRCMVCPAGDIKERVRAETSSGCSEGTEKVAEGRRAVSVEGIEGAIEGATEKGAVKAEGMCFNFL